jgi:hypothetical protein
MVHHLDAQFRSGGRNGWPHQLEQGRNRRHACQQAVQPSAISEGGHNAQTEYSMTVDIPSKLMSFHTCVIAIKRHFLAVYIDQDSFSVFSLTEEIRETWG